MITPKLPMILAPIELTLTIREIPKNIAITAIKLARILITARGNKRRGKKVSAKEIGPPKTVNEIFKVASSASDSNVLLIQNLQYFQPQPQSHH